MDYINTKQLSELKSCSERHAKRLIKNGKIKAELRFDPEIKQERYFIPIATLPDELQAKYYKRQKKKSGIAFDESEKVIEKPLKKVSKRVKRSLEDIPKDKYQIVLTTEKILLEWQNGRNICKVSKADFDRQFVEKCKSEYPEIKISVDILYRKWKLYKANDIEGLIDCRGGHNKGESSIPDEVWEAFLWFWLDENKPTLSLSYRNALTWTEEFHPELVTKIPHERTFERRIDRDVSYALRTLMRDGEKAFDDRCRPYIMRMYDNLEANDCWIADNHTLDIISTDSTNKHRLYLTAFLDAKSGMLTGWNVTDSPDSQSTLLALRHGILRCGIPKTIYVDNGREFLNIDIGGKGHRTRKSDSGKSDPTTILQRLGIEMRNAIVRNARAKPIERTFYTVKNEFSRLWTGFCGGTILERPEILKKRLKNGDIPNDSEIREFISKWIDGEYNQQNYGGSEQKFRGISRKEVFEKTRSEKITATPDVLNLMLMRSTRLQKVKRNGVYITISGEKIWFMHPEQTISNLDREVYVRYDPADLRSVRIYDEKEIFLFEWQNADKLMLDFLEENQQNISDAQEIIRTSKKYIRNQAKSIGENLTSEQRVSALEIAIRRAEKNLADGFKTELPKKVTLLTTNEEKTEFIPNEYEYYDNDSELEELKAMNDRLENAKKGA